MKVAQFLPYFPPHKGGVETVAEEFSKYFVKEGLGDVVNIVFSQDQPNVTKYQKDGYVVFVFPAFDIIPNYPLPKIWTRQFWDVLKQVRASKPDIIQTHTRFFLSTLLGGICSKLRNKKRVHVEHGSGLVKGLIFWKSRISNIYDYTLGKICFDSADQIVAISNANVPFIKKFSATPVEVIYRGIDFPQIVKEGKKFDKIVIGFIGRLVKLKGADILIDVFSQLEKNFPMLTLRIVGDGPERNFLEKKVQNLGLQGKVCFLGFQEKEKIQKEILPNIDVFVNPSFQEGLPTTVIEALFSKCIVVATDVGGTREISSQSDLIIIPPGNKQSLQNAISQAIIKNGQINGNSLSEIREKFDWNKNIKQYNSLYKRL